mmetsp:Transcript_3151/g.13667  ORF Transcript_3151/g.13667 Transcript_3151/m.13667 type:complete len:234 (+) Transcript_3151:6907-7608(+)
MCTSTHMFATCLLTSGEPRSTVERNLLETLVSASSGHSMNQSMVQQLIREGNWRHRDRKASPTGDMHRMMWRLSRTLLMNVLKSTSFVGFKPRDSAYGRISVIIRSFSSWANSPGTSPLLRMLLMSSRKFSWTICVSVNKKTTSFPSAPAIRSTLRRSSRHSFFPYPFATSIEKRWNSSKAAASRVRDCRPLPPTPSSNALPSGSRMTRQIRDTCSMASRNITSFIGAVVSPL